MKALKDKRMLIDDIDKQIMELLVKRFLVVEEIGIIKKSNKLMITDTKRENIIKEKINNYPTNQLHTKALKQIYETIIEVSKDLQNKKI